MEPTHILCLELHLCVASGLKEAESHVVLYTAASKVSGLFNLSKVGEHLSNSSDMDWTLSVCQRFMCQMLGPQ